LNTGPADARAVRAARATRAWRAAVADLRAFGDAPIVGGELARKLGAATERAALLVLRAAFGDGLAWADSVLLPIAAPRDAPKQVTGRRCRRLKRRDKHDNRSRRQRAGGRGGGAEFHLEIDAVGAARPGPGGAPRPGPGPVVLVEVKASRAGATKARAQLQRSCGVLRRRGHADVRGYTLILDRPALAFTLQRVC
jgi:hypothetical protein